MRESFISRHDRDRGERGKQLDHVVQGLRDLRTVDEQVSIAPIEEDTEVEVATESPQEHMSPQERSEVDYLRSISRDVNHISE